MPLNISVQEHTQTTNAGSHHSDLISNAIESESVKWDWWKLDQGMKLAQKASDFYLLYDLHLDEKDEGQFAELMNYLLPQFYNYTDMAIGGELRHGQSKIKAMAKKEIATPLRRAWSNGTLPKSRHVAWKHWRMFRKTYGTIALNWAMKSFNYFNVSSFGGPRWANIAKVLYMYEKGEITPITFVDTCWGLEHNGGAYFNKAWQIGNLKHVLDLNLTGNYEELRNYSTPAIRALHIKNGST